jgi:hypothetical protein
MKTIDTLMLISFILVNFCSSLKHENVINLKPSSNNSNFLEIRKIHKTKDEDQKVMK